MIIVTGGLGFVGYNLIKKLNSLKIYNIIIVDTKKKKLNNLKKIKYSKFIETKKFYKDIDRHMRKNIKCVFHQGANSSTTETNKQKIYEQNYYSSIKLLECAKKNNIKFIYASSAATYGINTKNFNETNWKVKPANLYGNSKLDFDKYVKKEIKKKEIQIIGLRYFNVYGPYEFHKKNMASVIFNFNKKFIKDKIISLFKGSNGYKNGEQLRDFVHVDDCVKVNLYFFRNTKSGIFNVGTGKCESFNKVANLILRHYGVNTNKKKYIEFPKKLKKSYQSYTKANISKLINSGYNKKFINLNNGVRKYLRFLNKKY